VLWWLLVGRCPQMQSCLVQRCLVHSTEHLPAGLGGSHDTTEVHATPERLPSRAAACRNGIARLTSIWTPISSMPNSRKDTIMLMGTLNHPSSCQMTKGRQVSHSTRKRPVCLWHHGQAAASSASFTYTAVTASSSSRSSSMKLWQSQQWVCTDQCLTQI